MAAWVSTDKLSQFLSGTERNAWIRVGSFEIYVRKAVRTIEGSQRHCLDIANISNVKTQGKGEFKALLPQILHIAHVWDRSIVYVENLLNPRFEDYLKREGFKYQPNTIPPSYYTFAKRISYTEVA